MADLGINLALPEEVIEAIAQRVAAILAEQAQSAIADWVTADVVAKHLGLSRVRVYELAAKEGMPHKRVGTRSMRFRLDEIDAWKAAA